MTQLKELAKPFPQNLRGKDERGNEAVDHTVVTQRLLQVVGPYDLEIAHILRSDVPEKKTQKGTVYPGGHFVTGVIVRLTLTIDGRTVSIEEVGGCENAALKDGDGERMKHAISDAIKRAAMRTGLGVHMWAQENFYLYAKLSEAETAGSAPASEPKAEGDSRLNPAPSASPQRDPHEALERAQQAARKKQPQEETLT